MGEMAEDFALMREYHRERKEKNRNKFGALLAKIRETHHVKQITEYQFRIDGVLDLYPSNHKFHQLKTGRRGHYSSDIKSVERLLENGRSIR